MNILVSFGIHVFASAKEQANFECPGGMIKTRLSGGRKSSKTKWHLFAKCSWEELEVRFQTVANPEMRMFGRKSLLL